MVPAAFRVLDAFLAVRTVTVHDCEDHVSLEMLDEDECWLHITLMGAIEVAHSAFRPTGTFAA